MTSNTKFSFNDKTFHLDKLVTACRSGLAIDVRLSDIDPNFLSSVQLPNDFDDSKQPVTFYFHGGKYYVLFGTSQVLSRLRALNEDTNKSLEFISGVLITKHALKRIEVIENEVDLVKQLSLDTNSGYGSKNNYQRRSYNDRGSRGASNYEPMHFEDLDYNSKSSRTSKNHQRDR